MSQRTPSRAGLLLWMCVMNRCLDTAAATSSTLSITHCEIMLSTNITCYWETTDHHLNDSSYRLQINITKCEDIKDTRTLDVCDTRGSYCGVKIYSDLHCFCAAVLAFTHTGSILSPPYFFKGLNSVRLRPPLITHLKPSEKRPGCLQVFWGTNERFLQDTRDHLRLQMEYTTHGQTRLQTIQAYNETLELCDLHPGSKYTVRLRAQDSRAHAYWSSWTSTDTTTEEKAPSAAPRLWRYIQSGEEAGKRRLTLLWKPVSWPEVNGVVLNYSASCHSELDSWTCGALNASRRSCVLVVSVDRCNCSLTATNSAGTSPPALIYIPALTDAEELPPLQTFNVTPLDDTRLKVEWTAALDQSESGFVLQWSSVPYNGPASLHWEHMNKSAKSFILTGLLPGVPYNLSAMSLYGHRAGSHMSVLAFTQEGAPSVGPRASVLNTSSSAVLLKWEPVPVEKLHGFIRHYTVLYSINGKSEEVHTRVEQVSLRGLTVGTYNICVMAHTAAGGAVGPCQMVAVGLEDVQVIPILLCALLLSFLIMIIPLCLRVRIKQCLCPTVPDPSKSSLSVWSNTDPCQHKLTSPMSSIIFISQATSYQGYGEKDYIPVQVVPYHTVRQDVSETNGTSTGTYLDPKLAPAQASPTHLFNQSYVKLDQVTPAGYKEDSQPSSADLLLESLLSCKRNQVDLSSFDHVSQSYVPFVTTVDAYRTLERDEGSHFLQVLPEDTST